MKILIIDDRIEILTFLKTLIETKYPPPLTATHADEALFVLSKNKINLCLVDYFMPEQNGIELIDQIKINYPQIVHILISGCFNAELLSLALERQVKGFLRKPFLNKELFTMLEKINLELKENTVLSSTEKLVLHFHKNRDFRVGLNSQIKRLNPSLSPRKFHLSISKPRYRFSPLVQAC